MRRKTAGPYSLGDGETRILWSNDRAGARYSSCPFLARRLRGLSSRRPRLPPQGKVMMASQRDDHNCSDEDYAK